MSLLGISCGGIDSKCGDEDLVCTKPKKKDKKDKKDKKKFFEINRGTYGEKE